MVMLVYQRVNPIEIRWNSMPVPWKSRWNLLSPSLRRVTEQRFFQRGLRLEKVCQVEKGLAQPEGPGYGDSLAKSSINELLWYVFLYIIYNDKDYNETNAKRISVGFWWISVGIHECHHHWFEQIILKSNNHHLIPIDPHNQSSWGPTFDCLL